MRWYDPTTGRWTQQDSLETLADPSRSNCYEYAAGNPTNYVDPTGRDFWDEVVGYTEDFFSGVSAGLSCIGAASYAVSTLGVYAAAFGGGVGVAGLAVASCAVGGLVSLAGGESITGMKRMDPKLAGVLVVCLLAGVMAIVFGLRSDSERSAVIVICGVIALGGVGLVFVGGFLQSRK